MPVKQTKTDHKNKSYRFAQGGQVPELEADPEDYVRGLVPKGVLRRFYDAIPSVKTTARTGKLFNTSEDVDAAIARERAKKRK